jgi:hypothetical protein
MLQQQFADWSRYFLLSSDDVEQIKQDDDRDWNLEQPKQNASPHINLLPDDKKLFLSGDLASGVLCVAHRTLNPTFGLIGLAFRFGAGVAQSFAGLFLDFAGDLLHTSCDTILIHCESLWLINRSENTVIRPVVPHRRK